MTDATTEGRGDTAAALPRREKVIPTAQVWNAAVDHSLTFSEHILGPYTDDNGEAHIECMGAGDPYERTCDFDTAKLDTADGSR